MLQPQILLSDTAGAPQPSPAPASRGLPSSLSSLPSSCLQSSDIPAKASLPPDLPEHSALTSRLGPGTAWPPEVGRVVLDPFVSIPWLRASPCVPGGLEVQILAVPGAQLSGLPDVEIRKARALESGAPGFELQLGWVVSSGLCVSVSLYVKPTLGI